MVTQVVALMQAAYEAARADENVESAFDVEDAALLVNVVIIARVQSGTTVSTLTRSRCVALGE